MSNSPSVLSYLKLLSPRTWYGAASVLSVVGTVQSFPTLITYWGMAISIVIVMQCVVVCHWCDPDPPVNRVQLEYRQKQMRSKLTLCGCAAFSMVFATVGDTIMVVKYMSQSMTERYETLPMAVKSLEVGVEAGRVKRHARYDLYLPPLEQINGKEEPTCTPGQDGESETCTVPENDNKESKLLPGLIFLPGALVEHSAYAPVMARLSDQGIPVAVLSVEPLRRPWVNLGASLGDISYVINDVAQRYDFNQTNIVWNLGGHSMGSYAAALLFGMNALKTPERQISIGTKLVFWGGGTYRNFVTDLSTFTVDVLSIHATKDGVAKFQNEEDEKSFVSKMPPSLESYTIEGGNHAGYAAYESKIPPDEVSTISLEEQHEILCNVTKTFLEKR